MNRIRLAAAPRGNARGIAFGVALAWSFSAGAQPPVSSPPVDDVQAWPEVETVHTLLRADAAAALADCRVPGVCRPGVVVDEPPVVGARTQDNIRVAAIFGSTRRLNIDVVVNGALLRYRAGHGAPVAGAVEADGYHLLAVEGACVHLRRGERDHTACLDDGRAHP